MGGDKIYHNNIQWETREVPYRHKYVLLLDHVQIN